MRKAFLFLFVAVMMFALPMAGRIWAKEGSHDMHDHHEHGGEEVKAEMPDMHPVMREDGVVELNNEKCLASGEDVSGEHFYEYSGVNYAFCCKMCIRDFKKNPEKFALSMDAIHEAMGHSGHAH